MDEKKLLTERERHYGLTQEEKDAGWKASRYGKWHPQKKNTHVAPGPGRPAGKYRPENEDLQLALIQGKVPKFWLKLMDHYCDETRTSRSDFIKFAIQRHLAFTGIYRYEAPQELINAVTINRNRHLDKYFGKNTEEREIDPGTWTTDQGDFGEPDDDPDESSGDPLEDEETGVQVHGSGSLVDPDGPEPSGDHQAV